MVPAPDPVTDKITVIKERSQAFSDHLNGFVTPPSCLQLFVDQFEDIKNARRAKEITLDDVKKYYRDITEAIKKFEEKTRNHPLGKKVKQIKSDLGLMETNDYPEDDEIAQSGESSQESGDPKPNSSGDTITVGGGGNVNINSSGTEKSTSTNYNIHIKNEYGVKK
jgi:hypothetical protein